ncbi:unnamed protein product [Ambrosiozyma monospora]|uniref:Unnamed protein product n=1 Tax=Ambrosiozyma monospora TaxID=43982 RepID=A0ACB5TMC2_AMBMO|nr:unnamed protein product [Ambrosiozyma monospora]
MNRFNILLGLMVESYTFVFDAALRSVNELASYALFLIHRVMLTSLKFFHFTMYFTARMMLIRQNATKPRHSILTEIIDKLILILQNVTKLHGFCADKYYTSLRIYGLLRYMTESFRNDKQLWLNVAMNQSFRAQKQILLSGLTDQQLTEINFKLSLLLQEENFNKFSKMTYLWNVNSRSDSLLNEIEEALKHETTYQEQQQQQQQQMPYFENTSTTYDAPIGPPKETEEQFQQPQPIFEQAESPFDYGLFDMFDMFPEEMPYAGLFDSFDNILNSN